MPVFVSYDSQRDPSEGQFLITLAKVEPVHHPSERPDRLSYWCDDAHLAMVQATITSVRAKAQPGHVTEEVQRLARELAAAADRLRAQLEPPF